MVINTIVNKVSKYLDYYLYTVQKFSFQMYSKYEITDVFLEAHLGYNDW